MQTVHQVQNYYVNKVKAAQICGVSESTFGRWVRSGAIKPVKIGASSKRYSVEQLKKLASAA